MRKFLLLLSFMALPVAASAVTVVGFDHARPLEPQSVQAGAAVSALDDAYLMYAMGRMGLLDELDAMLRAGFLVLRDEAGFEIEGGGKLRFLRTQDTGFVDLAAAVNASILKTGNQFLLGVDPTAIASHHFRIAPGRELFVGAGFGLALTFKDVDGGGNDTHFGLLGSFTAGVDIIERVSFALEARIRDDANRLGLAVTYQF
jgi:hypothetical protein